MPYLTPKETEILKEVVKISEVIGEPMYVVGFYNWSKFELYNLHSLPLGLVANVRYEVLPNGFWAVGSRSVKDRIRAWRNYLKRVINEQKEMGL